MGPDLHLEMIAHRTGELREAAENHRLARQVQAAEKAREAKKEEPEGKRRRGLFGKILPA
ncbi:hypothetical protein GCM10010517_61940 [Streptosporangium fragile]|uniref:Uncharacterized protein n=1 Tax=Streptosporangium fragile TaxID=46186 RepID=A0ABP6ILN3_9ACTN